MKKQVTKQVALNYLNQHSEVYVENLLLIEQTSAKWVYWSEEPINNKGEFYEVEIDADAAIIRWKIVKGFATLDSILREPIKALHTLRQQDTFKFQNDEQVWVCWLKLNDAPDGCYFIRPIEPDKHLGEGKAVPTVLVRYVGKWDRVE